jgi:DnaJ-class molecular chaperone
MTTDVPQGGDAAAAPRECSPCRGTGQVISNLGGSPQQVPCPWCEGTGRFIPGHDAQAARRPDGAGEG